MKISLRGVAKSFGKQTVFRSLDFDVEFEHTLALVGPSGGGKSTLLRLLAGLDLPDSGEIYIDGKRLPLDETGLRAHRQKIGIVFQAYNLFPHLSALQNIRLPLEQVHRLPPQEAKSRANQFLARFLLLDHADKQPAQLSGGQRQRIAIARALAIDPAFLLLDEPTSALDPEMTAEVLDVIAELRSSGKPIVLVTHEMGFARHTADLVALVADGGVPECSPAGEFFEQPRHDATQRFLQRVLKY
ncbi:MAG: amino acid ABC transporter ATP-binding protein [Terrimicrobiaceae bacterium]